MQHQILGLIVPAMDAIFAIAFLLLWQRDRSQTFVLFFMGSALSQAVAFTAFHLWLDTTDPVGTFLMHLLISASINLSVWGACKRAEQRFPAIPFAIATVATGVLVSVAAYYRSQMGLIFAANAFYAVPYLYGALAIARTGSRKPVERAIFWLFTAYATQFYIRPVMMTVFHGTVTAEEWRGSPYYSVLVLAFMVMTLVSGLVFMGVVVADLARKLEQGSTIDGLSGMLMRGPFERAMEQLKANAIVREKPFSIILADLDHFKQVNDMWGHAAGDKAIAAFGRLVRETVRTGDVCGRVGGEEFCIGVWNCDAEDAARLAERLRTRFAGHAAEGIPAGWRLTASFGVAEWQGDESYSKMFARADTALYRAKDGGRNKVAGEGVHVIEDANRDNADHPSATASAPPTNVSRLRPAANSQDAA